MCKNIRENGSYAMFDEIMQQVGIIEFLSKEQYFVQKRLSEIADIENLCIDTIIVVASGSSYNCAQIVLSLDFVEDFEGICFYKEISSEIESRVDEYFSRFKRDSSLIVFISQSGETKDTLNVARYVISKGFRTLSITNNRESQLCLATDYTIDIKAGKEVSIAATKSFMSQVYCFIRLLNIFVGNRDIERELRELLPKELKKSIINFRIEEELQKAVNCIDNVGSILNISVLGNGIDFEIGKECALKIKETTYIPAYSNPFEEFLHGHMALLNRRSLVVAFICENNYKVNISTLKSLEDRYDFEYIIISSIEELRVFKNSIMYAFDICNISKIFIKIYISQLLAFFLSKSLGCEVDVPKGLSKVVK